eukprot:scaffold271_cov206-Alexandrium_tamarense.AAC.10
MLKYLLNFLAAKNESYAIALLYTTIPSHPSSVDEECLVFVFHRHPVEKEGQEYCRDPPAVMFFASS